MRTRIRRGARIALAMFVSSAPALADEGQWTPDQIAELDHGRLSALGLRLPASALWNEEGGLLRAAVNLSGCSAGFVSKEGLIATNHHCAYRAIQSQSTPEQNYLADGFVAKKRDKELQAKGYTVRVLSNVRDVTERVKKAGEGAADDRARFLALEKAQKEIVAECEKKASARCDVASFYLGKQYKLFETVELKDIRLVYAPPAAIGEYGGEIDNWMWPRHTGDFALLRAYVGKDGKPAEYSADNVPYQPKHFFEVSAEGIRPGELVMVTGYPGRTNRYLPAAEVKRQVEQVLPAVVSLYGEWLSALSEEEKRGKDVAIKIAATQKSLANRHKNARGMLEGIARLGLLAKRQKEDERMAAWAKSPGREAHAKALTELTELATARRESFDKEWVLASVARGPGLTATALDLARVAREKKKPDLERTPGYQERDLPQLWKTIERRLRDFDPGVEARLLAPLIARAKALPKEHAIPSLAAFGAGADAGAIAKGLSPKLRGSKLANAEATKKLFEGDPAAIEKLADPVLALGRALAEEVEKVEAVDHARDGAEARVGPLYFDALKELRGGPIYPDANGTLRFSYATVKGYSPRDGLLATPQTTLKGAVQKHTGEDPFALPAPVLEKAPAARDSFWADPDLADVPVCFLSNADTTGGNSGSPMLNGKGQLVGLNFDRVWENIAGDFGYSTERSRNIGVDVRYMLWLLDRVRDAGPILRELGVAQYRSAPAKRSKSPNPHRGGAQDAGTPVAPTPAKSSCGCRAVGADGNGAPALLVALAGILARRRRRRQ